MTDNSNPATHPSSNDKPTDNNELALTEEDIQELQEQGVSQATIDSIASKVNEQLNSNANSDEQANHKDNHLDDKTRNFQFLKQRIQQDISDDIQHNIKNQIQQQWQQSALNPDKIDQEAQYEAFKQFLAKKNSEQKIDYRQVRLDIESGALPTRTFYLLNILASFIAGFGMLANSSVVVIGAMLIAVLMGPISAIALAIIDARFPLLKRSFFTLISGGVVIFLIGLLLGFLYPEQTQTQEILSRTAPTSIDVFVALAGGIAGAYAMISNKLSVAVIGVAVATTLVPPLTASGILVAVGQYQLAGGALLYTLTNILAIQFTNALVLWIAGFRRLDIDEAEDEKANGSTWQQSLLFARRNLVTLILLTGISIYLTLNFEKQVAQQRYEKTVSQIVQDGIANQPSYITSTSFNEKKSNSVANKNDKQYLIRIVLQGLTPPSSHDIRQMEQKIQTLTKKNYPNRPPVKLQVRFVPEQVIETDPVTKDDVKLDDTSINQMKQGKNK